jgi:hypothetical protein
MRLLGQGAPTTRKHEHVGRALSALGSTGRTQKHARPYALSVLQCPARGTTQPRPCVAFVLAGSAARGSSEGATATGDGRGRLRFVRAGC